MSAGGDPVHLKPAAELAERVLLPGDPHRALAVAQALLESPRMFNHQRGLWGYTGRAPDGRPVTIQATGMGGPSAAIVVAELLALGARRLIRIGTCGAIGAGLDMGELVNVGLAIAQDGASRALGAGERVAADATMSAALEAAGGGAARTVVSTDLFYDGRPGMAERWRAAGAVAVEMEAATVLQLAASRGVPAGCLLTVSDRLAGDRRQRVDREALESAGLRLGKVALAALERL